MNQFMVDIADNQLKVAAEMWTRKHHPDLSKDAVEHYKQVQLYLEFAEMMEGHYKQIANHFHKEACNALNLKLPEPFIIESKAAR